MKKGPAALLVVFGMALGSVLTTVLNPIGAASALVGASSSSGHESILQQALDTLVGKGTITKQQADAVQNQVHSLEQQHAKDFGFGHHPGPGMLGPMTGALGAPHGAFEQLFNALKTDPQALFSELRSGKTISQIAKEKGVDVAKLRQQLITTANDGIDQAVKNGWMTAAEAAKLKAKVPTQVDDMLNRSWNEGFGMPMHGGPLPHAGTGGTTTTTTH
ncbi:MAG TPA: hypothetical protein VMT43_13295 [Acidimicrobiales bacterium]|nr:hypothetical protein [Acidimicrobiales bacterium]